MRVVKSDAAVAAVVSLGMINGASALPDISPRYPGLAGEIGVAAAAPANPAITARAMLAPRANIQTEGWYSYTTDSARSAVYQSITYDASSSTYTTSGAYIRRCAVGVQCTMYTGCSSGYGVAAGTSTFCGTGGTSASALICSSDILYTTSGANQAYSLIWCDSPTNTGIVIYNQKPGASLTSAATGSSGISSLGSAVVSSSPTSTPSSTRASSSLSTSSPSPTTTQPGPTSTSPVATSSPKSTNTGAIAGGVVGGVAVLGAIGVAIFFILRRNKNKNQNNPPPHAAPAHGPTDYPPHGAAAPVPGGYAPTPGSPGAGLPAYQQFEKPVGVASAQEYPPSAQANYNKGGYNPHVASHDYPEMAGSPPPQPQTQPYSATPAPTQTQPYYSGPSHGAELAGSSPAARPA